MTIQDAHLPILGLTPENFEKGFLIDHEWMGGVSEDPDTQGRFWAFIVNHQTGEYVTAHAFLNVDEALHALNKVKRDWKYETAKSCGGGKCGSGACGTGGCGGGGCGTAPAEDPGADMGHSHGGGCCSH